jgi:uncharacterized membrane protein YgdD (TMEM256/DUF423 family)
MDKLTLLSLQKLFLMSGAAMGFLAVALGAFGAHALKQKLSADMLAIFEVGVRYQMYHALAIIIVALAAGWITQPLLSVALWLFLSGTVIFSGSLYILALSDVRAWGAVTPIGGLLLLAGWLCLFIGIWKH